MAIVNRDKDSTEQYEVIKVNVGALATGVTRELWVAPWPCTIDGIKIVGTGVSGTPTVKFQVNRFIVGTGATVYVGATAQPVTTLATSGVQGVSYMYHASLGGVTGSMYVQAKDVLELVSAGTNAALGDCLVEIKAKKTQDILSIF
jgi:hypothetical protein